MEKFIIKEIKGEFEERWLKLKKIDDNREFGVYFYEYSEDAGIDGIIKKRKVGDILEGNLFIGWITTVEKTDEELTYIQNYGYTGIRAIVEITELLEEGNFYAKNSIVDREIVLDLEMYVDLNKGDRIYVEGSLQIELEEYKKELDFHHIKE